MTKFNFILNILWTTVSIVGCGESNHPTTDGEMETTSNKSLLNTTNMITQKITPSLWVDKDAKAVVDYYLSIFKDGKLKETTSMRILLKQKPRVVRIALKQR